MIDQSKKRKAASVRVSRIEDPRFLAWAEQLDPDRRAFFLGAGDDMIGFFEEAEEKGICHTEVCAFLLGAVLSIYMDDGLSDSEILAKVVEAVDICDRQRRETFGGSDELS